MKVIPGFQPVTRQRNARAHRDGLQAALSGVDTAPVDQAVRRPPYVADSTADKVMIDQTKDPHRRRDLQAPGRRGKGRRQLGSLPRHPEPLRPRRPAACEDYAEPVFAVLHEGGDRQPPRPRPRPTGGSSLLVLGGLLALYDGAELLLKPAFGSVADRIGANPVLVGGLIAAAASALYVVADSPGWLWAARLGQGTAASAFFPSASAPVARLNPAARHGRAFGGYGFHKAVGYTLGPLLGSVLVWAGGLRLLFTVLAVLGAAVAVWAVLAILAVLAVPVVPPLPKPRQTVLDLALALARRLADPVFRAPTAALAGATAALSVAAGLGTVAIGAAVSVLAGCAALVQPQAGRALDDGRLTTRTGLAAGLSLTVAGLACAMLPGLTGISSRRS
ncbi:hypothetical protein GCM10010302_10530 [Streptomyces polychromogenes]|uniref:MFS transporter n=1 Tax=Streptomyces polychromogenes TaxID=67342 RepID=A0ABP3ERN0_9ACTN